MSAGRQRAIVVTWEYASNDVPPELRGAFRGHAALRRTHLGTARYAGVELELRQDLATAARTRTRDRVADGLVEAIGSLDRIVIE